MTPVPSRTLRRLATLAAWVVVLAAYLHPADGLGVSICPSKALTSLPCPGCGLTRSVSSAARADLARSWHYHPFGFIFLLAVLAVAVVGTFPSRARDPVWAWATRRRSVLSTLVAAYLIALFVFGIARMAGLIGHIV